MEEKSNMIAEENQNINKDSNDITSFSDNISTILSVDIPRVTSEFQSLLKVNDPEETPFLSRISAYKLLERLHSHLSKLIQSSKDQTVIEEAQMELAHMGYLIGVTKIECDDVVSGEEFLSASIPVLETKSDENAVALLDAFNQLGIIWANRDEWEDAMTFFRRAEEAYSIEKQNVQKEQFAKENSEKTPSSDENNEQLQQDVTFVLDQKIENMHTLTLFYIGQVYGQLGDKEQSAKYFEVTLGRQLQFGDYSLSNWIMDCCSLATQYIEMEDYEKAKCCLGEALHLLNEVKEEAKAKSENSKDSSEEIDSGDANGKKAERTEEEKEEQENEANEEKGVTNDEEMERLYAMVDLTKGKVLLTQLKALAKLKNEDEGGDGEDEDDEDEEADAEVDEDVEQKEEIEEEEATANDENKNRMEADEVIGDESNKMDSETSNQTTKEEKTDSAKTILKMTPTHTHIAISPSAPTASPQASAASSLKQDSFSTPKQENRHQSSESSPSNTPTTSSFGSSNATTPYSVRRSHFATPASERRYSLAMAIQPESISSEGETLQMPAHLPVLLETEEEMEDELTFSQRNDSSFVERAKRSSRRKVKLPRVITEEEMDVEAQMKVREREENERLQRRKKEDEEELTVMKQMRSPLSDAPKSPVRYHPSTCSFSISTPQPPSRTPSSSFTSPCNSSSASSSSASFSTPSTLTDNTLNSQSQHSPLSDTAFLSSPRSSLASRTSINPGLVPFPSFSNTLDEVAPLFRECLASLNKAALFYVLDGYVSDHVAIKMDISSLFQTMTAWYPVQAQNLLKDESEKELEREEANAMEATENDADAEENERVGENLGGSKEHSNASNLAEKNYLSDKTHPMSILSFNSKALIKVAEDDLHNVQTQLKLHMRRVMALEPLISQLNPSSYSWLLRDIAMEAATAMDQMAQLKTQQVQLEALKIMKEKEKENAKEKEGEKTDVGRSDEGKEKINTLKFDELLIFLLSQVNEYVKKAIFFHRIVLAPFDQPETDYNGFYAQQDESAPEEKATSSPSSTESSSALPSLEIDALPSYFPTVPTDVLPAYLSSHFAIARLFTRFVIIDEEVYTANLKRALDEYSFIVGFYEHYRVDYGFEEEIAMCRQMTILLPRTISEVSSGSIPLPSPIPKL
ncbi:putative KIF-1 binding protein C terminal [Monocercomonoides exilis]|uniref:putative KIF-1 binding protein C terminal n=1 Tax=Monocercomonoides exilis TaxID=2049356 RepID=UPI00355AAA6E|nr:putative KIF-1 binding protein C terminal [Monocercomonoides exilis]|eukprot:MONOS_2236.1-p1 / transcript=MONOS_2236.1 / gene=MONOS_2236 / organism=Monocercomonoides_exilis_PA203 / gene_product=unspecified product / transcript_product=unspecified product / location=Mono_scaffold00045:23549-27329(-) / protein_length=1147 / sequence_SO=supercontig / SO=protein_coding / is_pseudo=false